MENPAELQVFVTEVRNLEALPGDRRANVRAEAAATMELWWLRRASCAGASNVPRSDRDPGRPGYITTKSAALMTGRVFNVANWVAPPATLPLES